MVCTTLCRRCTYAHLVHTSDVSNKERCENEGEHPRYKTHPGYSDLRVDSAHRLHYIRRKSC